MHVIRKWTIDNKSLNDKCIEEVITRIQEIEDPDRIGAIGAQDIIDIVLENMGPEIYNKAIDNATKYFSDKFEEIEYTAEDLKQS
ncbi:MAG TPA: DUF2164 family protein [Candidatus Saccharimonas sp.]|nr:DUF2164 family protein [Candidatus Saccharimonas sp.]